MHKNLIEWTKAYVKYRDAIHRKIVDMEIDKHKIILTNKDGNKDVYLCEDVLKMDPKSVKDEKVVCLNKKENLDWLIKNWNIVKESRTIFIFANINVSQSWAIHPSMHEVITGKGALKPGLQALFASVPEVK